MKSEPRGLIFDIQGFSVHDGPGSRTTVFLSGCPLNCQWCANPEGMELRRRLLFSSQKCRNEKDGCRRCQSACPRGAIRVEDGKMKRREEVCAGCEDYLCAAACYQEALRLSGRWYTVEELMAVLHRDRQFWENGGVTFSGGDPLLQKEFLLRALKRCREESIHTAIETSGYAMRQDFLEIMSYIDLAFVDVKHMDSSRHMEKTGRENGVILENIAALSASAWPGRLILRIPVIEGYNDSDDNMKKVICFMKTNRLFEVNLLPFHRMGKTKWTQLNRVYPYGEQAPTGREKLEELQRLFLFCGIACYIGDEIIY